MRFGILGPLLVHDGAVAVDVPAGRQRVLLAALLLDAGRAVSADELADTMWDGSPPPGAAATLRTHVMRLRRALGPLAGARLVTRYPGYLIDAAEDEVDLLRFTRLCRDGGAAVRDGAWAQAAGLLAEALGMWRGTPLADVSAETLHRDEVPKLQQLRLQALEWRVDAELHMGRHAELVPELESLAAEHPLRERFHAQLMLAQFRCGRRAEALTAYQRARSALVSELGIEPGPELRELHEQVLSADDAAEPSLSQPPAGGPAPVVPRELPAGVRFFTGRAAELAALTGLLDHRGGQMPGMVVVSAIGGTAGVGKTALAVHWAHQVADRFPDGQLYVNLRGYDPGQPMPAADALAGFLRALGVPGRDIPAEEGERAASYRSLLAGQKVLILLDNARDEQQVRPLLPAGPGSMVIVTSRSQLSGLAAADGARLLSLDVLSHAEAVHLLTARLGTARAAAEPEAVAEIVSLCAYLPLALAVAAARAAGRPGFPLAALAAEFADSADRLHALDAGDPAASVRAVFSWSTRQLTGPAARMFRLLGLHAGPDITAAAAASLAATTEADARRLLRELARAHLVAEHAAGRYSCHDLLRAYAVEQAGQTDSEPDRTAAIGRVLDYYLHTAAAAAGLLDPSKEPVALSPPRLGAAPGRLADHSEALAWFEAEHHVLLGAVRLAAESLFDAHAWQLPWAMTPFLNTRGYWQEWVATERTALAAATRLGDTAAQALSGRLLANAYGNLGDHDEARSCYAGSLSLYQRLGDRLGEARTHQNLGVLAWRQGRYADALEHARQALRLHQTGGDKANVAEALNDVGYYHGLLGDYEQAGAVCREVLALSAEIGHRRLEGAAWDSLGYAEHHLGNLAEAATCYQRALSLFRETGERWYEAEVLIHLGDTRHDMGELAQAQAAWQQALAILGDLQHPDAAQVRAKLASISDHAASNWSA